MTTQLDLEFTRGDQLGILRAARLGDPRKSNDRKPLAKLLLRTLDDRIGRNKRWAMTVDELAEEADMSRSAAYQWLGWLNEAGIIGFDSLPDGRREFWICWSTLWQFTPEGRTSESRRANPPGGSSVHNMDQRSTTRTDGPPHGPPVHVVDCSYKEERPLSAHSAPTPSPSSSADGLSEVSREEAMMMVNAAGVKQFGHVVETALANGMTTQQIAAVVAHFQAHPDKWPPEILFERLTRIGACLIGPNEGWYGDTDKWKAQQRRLQEAQAAAAAQAAEDQLKQQREAERHALEGLNAAVGDVFDGMSKAERLGLIPPGHPDESVLRSAVKFGIHEHVRGTFLRLLIEAMGGEDRAERDHTSAAAIGRKTVTA